MRTGAYEVVRAIENAIDIECEFQSEDELGSMVARNLFLFRQGGVPFLDLFTKSIGEGF